MNGYKTAQNIDIKIQGLLALRTRIGGGWGDES